MADKDGGEMLSITTLHTDRLIGTSLSAEDFDDLCNMHQEPRVMATLGGLRSAEQTQRLLRENLDHWEKCGYGIWVFRQQSDRRFVGHGGLRNVTLGGKNEVDVTYAVMAEFWNKGVATEVATVSIQPEIHYSGTPSFRPWIENQIG